MRPRLVTVVTVVTAVHGPSAHLLPEAYKSLRAQDLPEVRDLDHAIHLLGWFLKSMGYELFQSWDNGRSWQHGFEVELVAVEASAAD